MKIPRFVSSLFASTLVLVLFAIATCFLLVPELAFKYNSYFSYRFIPYWGWAAIYYSVSCLGWKALYERDLDLWAKFSFLSVAVFAFNVISFAVAFVVANGTPTTLAIHICFLIRAFQYCRSPLYWLTVLVPVGGRHV